MSALSLLPWLQKAFEFLAFNFLKKSFPQYAGLFDRANDVMALALEVVSAAEASGEDGAAKKKAASASLLKKLKDAGIDIPGDHDTVVADLLVEATVAAVKRFLGQS